MSLPRAASLALALALSGCHKDTPPSDANAPTSPSGPAAASAPAGASAKAPPAPIIPTGNPFDPPVTDPTGMRRCCRALAQKARTVPPAQKKLWDDATSACEDVVEGSGGRGDLSRVREGLKGAPWPPECSAK